MQFVKHLPISSQQTIFEEVQFFQLQLIILLTLSDVFESRMVFMQLFVHFAVQLFKFLNLGMILKSDDEGCENKDEEESGEAMRPNVDALIVQHEQAFQQLISSVKVDPVSFEYAGVISHKVGGHFKVTNKVLISLSGRVIALLGLLLSNFCFFGIICLLHVLSQSILILIKSQQQVIILQFSPLKTIYFIVINQQKQMTQSTPQSSRYKSIESEEDTRNPTTNKKMHPTPAHPRPNHHMHQPHPLWPAHQLSHLLLQLQAKKSRHISRKQYSSAEKIDNRIRKTKTQIKDIKIHELIEGQKHEKRAISAAHQREMKYLHQLWGNYFDRVRQRQVEILRAFKQEQYSEIAKAKYKLQKKCESLRTRSKESIDLKKEQSFFLKTGNLKELARLNKQIQQANQKHERAKKEQFEKWTKAQEEQLGAHQARRYSVLVGRLEENRKDKERMYLREQRRLRQKYRNVLSQMDHEHKMEKLSAMNWQIF